MESQHWILWDGECGLCRRATRWIARKDTQHVFRFTPYQEAPSPPMTPELKAACENAVHIITTDGTILRAGRAVLFILENIGWGFVARLLALPPFIWFMEIGYAILAANRPFFANFLFTKE
jgi:predicted DCC family thiol-disulfide oxidoreductase YuxK